MKTRIEKFDGTFVLGFSYSSFISKYTNKKVRSFIFDLGILSIAFIFNEVK